MLNLGIAKPVGNRSPKCFTLPFHLIVQASTVSARKLLWRSAKPVFDRSFKKYGLKEFTIFGIPGAYLLEEGFLGDFSPPILPAELCEI
jgi:hypothetical protein